ncbi:MAG: beta-ketoacyl-[acyl-carrier-protein] synthase family protein [Thermodesulfobacteriota bacterium]
MPLNRVVITGMGAVSPYGNGVEILLDSLFSGKNAIQTLPEMEQIKGLKSFVAGIVPEIDSKTIARKYRRTMSKMSIYAALAATEALSQGKVEPYLFQTGDLGVAIGSTIGSIGTMENFFRDYFSDNSLERTRSTLFFQIMNHSCAANVSQMFGIKGTIIAPSAACASAAQAIGIGFDAVASGKIDMMLCGGSDEFHPLFTGTFDLMNAASTHFNRTPSSTPRPFEQNRDGVVCSEGCGLILLESLGSAKRRNADIFAEVVGFASLSDPSSIANPDAQAIRDCMEKALKNAGVNPDQVDYINAHATGTVDGDIAECTAIGALFGNTKPVSSLKGHLGHTMAASGSLEIIGSIGMMEKKQIIPTLNLDKIDPMCNKTRHVQRVESAAIRYILKNSFALGGVNSSLVLRRYGNERFGNR